VSAKSAILDLVVQVENKGEASREVEVVTDVHEFDPETGLAGYKVSEFQSTKVLLPAGEKKSVNGSTIVENPQLWGPPPSQTPNLYVAITHLYDASDKEIDTYETRFGIRSVAYDADEGLSVNGEKVHIQGVNQHHDQGSLGSAFHVRAAERQLEILQDLGCNAIRMSHNPPAPELLELADRMGFVVMDEVFDCWEIHKTPNDFSLIFPEWHEADLRSYLRRDRNHPSIVMWSFGNEVQEQYAETSPGPLARSLHDIVFEEDPTRPSTISMNYAKADTPLPQEVDVESLNYQGEGIRDTPAYAGIDDDVTLPQYDNYHAAFPEKMLLSTETAAALSTRGTFMFPVTNWSSSPVSDDIPGSSDSTSLQISAYELYSSDFGASADKVFAVQYAHPFVAGEFVWSGWDYLGEPTPYDGARSSYFGIIDLAGFKKERYHLYQARWRPDLPTAHILPHWSWPDERIGQVTPVHVFSSADEAELFVNGKSQGTRTKDESNFRFRWDDVVYEPGEVRVVTYKNDEKWATETVRTVGEAAKLRLTPDRDSIDGDGKDLSFLTLEVVDNKGDVVPYANNTITFSASGPGEIVSTDNGDPADFVPFPSPERNAFSGLALAIVRAEKGAKGPITVTASAKGLREAKVTITAH
jgi:beta-galactosidase